tara:strand:+ start:306 stop:659 length:354 start_codon:yes stop_codon:yes gene_type:complete
MAEDTNTTENKKLTKKENVVVGVLLGGIVGFLGGMIISKFSSPQINTGKVFSLENRLEVQRIDKWGEDQILVKDPNDSNSNTYIPLDSYLRTISNNYDKAIEENKIKKLVDWKYTSK